MDRYFRTIIDIPASKNKINHKNKSVFIGSCFAENIGNKFLQYKFPADLNPFGVIYNPISVKKSLEILIEKKSFGKKDLYFHNENWFSFYHHSSFSDIEQNNCLEKINTRILSSSDFLEKADFLFITFGTSYVYELIESQQIVSNCHKLPAKHFNRYLLSVDEIVENLKELIEKLHQFNKNLKIVLTVSPVRHWKDGARENQISKSTLIIAINELMKEFRQIEYFPAYEIVMDELRDYRFYDEDMFHPNATAINYLWKKFNDIYFNNRTKQLCSEINKLIQAMGHKPFNPHSENHKKFLKSHFEKTILLNKQYPFLDLTEIRDYFE